MTRLINIELFQFLRVGYWRKLYVLHTTPFTNGSQTSTTAITQNTNYWDNSKLWYSDFQITVAGSMFHQYGTFFNLKYVFYEVPENFVCMNLTVKATLAGKNFTNTAFIRVISDRVPLPELPRGMDIEETISLEDFCKEIDKLIEMPEFKHV